MFSRNLTQAHIIEFNVCFLQFLKNRQINYFVSLIHHLLFIGIYNLNRPVTLTNFNFTIRNLMLNFIFDYFRLCELLYSVRLFTNLIDVLESEFDGWV